MSAIKVYSTGCSRCRIIEGKLEGLGIKYEKETDIEVMKSKGIMSVPVIEVDGKLLTYGEAVKYINDLGGK